MDDAAQFLRPAPDPAAGYVAGGAKYLETMNDFAESGATIIESF